jgi:anti-anti-sigma regulatory factor
MASDVIARSGYPVTTRRTPASEPCPVRDRFVRRRPGYLLVVSHQKRIETRGARISVDPPAPTRGPGLRVRTHLGTASRHVSLVELNGEHDYGSKARLEAALDELHEHVLVDLSGCELIDTAIINVILTKHRELRREGFKLELIVPPAQVHLSHIFDLLGIRSLLTVRDHLPLGL